MAVITKKEFGIISETQNYLYTLKNGDTELSVMSRGATIVSIKTMDKIGNMIDVALGYDTAKEYTEKGGFLGAIIGRNSNRIAGAKFVLNGKEYNLSKNDGNNNLHGGPNGFDTKMWNCEDVDGKLVCKLSSEDGDGGFPGNAEITVTYSLSADNEVKIKYHAVCDQDTVMNLTNHNYFNLNGHDSGSIVNHTMQINADFYTPLDDGCTPYGEVRLVKDTVFDFNTAKIIADDIDNIPNIEVAGGFDHNFILKSNGKEVKLAAVTTGDKTGITMETYTNKPAVQFYAGNMMDTCSGKNGANYTKRYGFCLETQNTPNCHNIPHLGNAFLRKGEVYSDTTIYKFIK